jgi:hypothetical protein
MDSQTKTFVLHDVIRRFATAGKILPPRCGKTLSKPRTMGTAQALRWASLCRTSPCLISMALCSLSKS